MNASATWARYEGGNPFVTVGTPTLADYRALRVHATRCAAWYVWRHRGQLKRQGAIYATLSGAAPEPKWFTLALTLLTKRRGWLVRTASLSGGTVCYRVERVS